MAPFKLMSKVTRMKSANRAYCGKYQVSDSLWTVRNLEFSDVVFAGTLGMPYNKNLNERVNQRKVQAAFDKLCQLNRRLEMYRGPLIQELYARFTLTKIKKDGDPVPVNSWSMNHLMPIGDVIPNASEVAIDDLVIGIFATTT